MKFSHKLKVMIFLSGTAALLCFAAGMHYFYSRSLMAEHMQYSQALAQSTARDFKQLLLEKVKTALTMANTPLLKQVLAESNRFYGRLSAADRQETITRLDDRWRENPAENDPFVRLYTDNPVAEYLKQQQASLQDEYGEIFLTNRYGALTASTAKLTTFAHGRKYWWQGAFQEGQGAVYFDDRGYDASVQGYVLGLVVPVRGENGLLGILKCNLNILGAISTLITQADSRLLGRFELVRSGGAVIFETGSPPLSTRLPADHLQHLDTDQKGVFRSAESGPDEVVGFATVALDSELDAVRFGGSAVSMDHAKGNRGESWIILNRTETQNVLDQAYLTIGLMALVVGFVLFVLAVAAHVFGRRASRPLKELIRKSRRVAAGDFNVRISSTRKDEIGYLSQAFNQMAEALGRSTTSITALEQEVALRKQSESEKEALISELRQTLGEVKELQGLLPICSFCKKIRDDQGYWNHVDAYIAAHSKAELTHSLCPECARTQYPDLDIYDAEEDES
ncbi:MAG: HAMP domain-containing protein [Desulfohalobiaceae bacterium]|nr:HAMP domain-containing protein [Desulfohalobiaceae bacterium]